MKRTKHTGAGIHGCAACITAAEIARHPWEASYLDVFTKRPEQFERKHKAALARNERNQAMRDMGMVKTPYGWE